MVPAKSTEDRISDVRKRRIEFRASLGTASRLALTREIQMSWGKHPASQRKIEDGVVRRSLLLANPFQRIGMLLVIH